MRVWRQWRDVPRERAARVIQKHWRAALVDVPGAGKVHRSRVVRHKGVKYNARPLSKSLPAVPGWNNDMFRHVWPGTTNELTNDNKRRVTTRGDRMRNVNGRNVRRSRPNNAVVQRKLDYHSRRMNDAMNANKKGKFGPYDNAGWTMDTFRLVRMRHVVQDGDIVEIPRVLRTVRLPTQIRWDKRMLMAVLGKRLGVYIEDLRHAGGNHMGGDTYDLVVA